MKFLSVVGARPQFVKLAVIARALAGRDDVTHAIVHTGQHYDEAMSGSFFRELGIPAPAHDLEVGSGPHGWQTAEMLRRLEPVLEAEAPDWVLIYGDTNSSVAGALGAAKLHQRVAHIESGLRSFNRAMPEEINRIVADHVSDLLFVPTTAGMENLRREGLGERAVLTGDIMYDAVLAYLSLAESRADSPARAWAEGSYALATVHRAENTDDPERLRAIVAGLDGIAGEICPVVLAVHPRTRKAMEMHGIAARKTTVIPPVSYADMLLLEKRARLILTDSGGVQKEAYFVRVPCVTLRDETEWTETLANGCNVLAGADAERIIGCARATASAGPWGDHYGRGDSGAVMVKELLGR